MLYSNRSFAHLRLEEYGSAVADASKAIELDPRYVKVRPGSTASGHTVTWQFPDRLSAGLASTAQQSEFLVTRRSPEAHPSIHVQDTLVGRNLQGSIPHCVCPSSLLLYSLLSLAVPYDRCKF